MNIILMPPLSVAHVICGLDMENKYICNVAHVTSIMENSLIYEKNERIFLLPSSLPCIYFYWVHWASGKFLTNFGAMHLYLYSAYSYSIQSHLYSKLLYILQNLMHTLARPPIFGQICCIFWSRPILPRQAGLNSASFGSHDSRSEVRDGVQPFMGSPILTVSPS